MPYALRRITEAGARIFFYLTDQEVKRDTAVDRFQGSVMAFVDEMHREQSRRRTRDALRRQAERGHVAGGKVYGYRNVEVRTDDKRSHVLREIHAGEAEVVRRILREIAAGAGFCRVPKRLNAEGIPSPRQSLGWAVSGVRELALRELYRGVVVYGKTRWEDRGGTKVKVNAPPSEPSEWITVEAPALRVVDEALWRAAHARLDKTRVLYARQTDGKLIGRPAGSGAARSLLSGILRCAHCGHSVAASTRQTTKRGQRRTYRYYVCAGHRERGPTVCAVPLRAPLEALEDAILAEIEAKVLRPEILEAVVARARVYQAERAARQPDRRAELERQLRAVRQEIDRYVAAIGAGADLVEVKVALADRKGRAEVLEAELVGLRAATPALDTSLLRRRVEDWRACLRRGPAVAQQILRKLFPDRLKLELTAEGVRFSGLVMVTQLLAGAGFAVSVVPPG